MVHFIYIVIYYNGSNKLIIHRRNKNEKRKLKKRDS